MRGANLIVACWGGKRRLHTPAYEADRAYFARQQAAHLERFRHSLAQVTFVVPEGGDPALGEYLSSLRRIRDARVAVLRRPNEGLSYGSWDHALRLTHRDFDHHLLLEDDYVFVEDGFDRTLAEWHDSLPDCGYLCSMVQEVGGRRFAGVSNGVCRSDHYLLASALHGGKLPYVGGQVEGHGYYAYHGEGGQVEVGACWECCGRRIHDITARYSVAWCMNGLIRCLPAASGRFLLVPTQLREWQGRGVPEVDGIGQPGAERTMLPYPPPQWFLDQVASRASIIGVPAA